MDVLTIVVLTAILIVAVWTDSTRQIIPNRLIMVGLLTGAICAGLSGWQALAIGLAGFAAGLVLFLPAYAFAGMGAGDVKLLAVVGLFIGPKGALLVALATLLIGGAIGVGILLYRGETLAFIRRYWLMLTHAVVSHRPGYFSPNATSAAASSFPYAVPIALGTLAVLWHDGRLLGAVASLSQVI